MFVERPGEIVVQRVHASLASCEDLIHAVDTPGPFLVLDLVDGFAAVGSGEVAETSLGLEGGDESPGYVDACSYPEDRQ